jgi:hypothetical protein
MLHVEVDWAGVPAPRGEGKCPTKKQGEMEQAEVVDPRHAPDLELQLTRSKRDRLGNR